MGSVAGKLIGTGVAMGAVHVLTGPDHLSALATLSANVGGRSRWREAFGLGVRWGIGHSAGLVVVAAVLIALTEGRGEDDDATVTMPETTSATLESAVGAFMLLLGAYGLVRAFRRRRERALGGGGVDPEGEGEDSRLPLAGKRASMDSGVSSSSNLGPDEEEDEEAGMTELSRPSSPSSSLPQRREDNADSQEVKWQGGEASLSLADADLTAIDIGSDRGGGGGDDGGSDAAAGANAGRSRHDSDYDLGRYRLGLRADLQSARSLRHSVPASRLELSPWMRRLCPARRLRRLDGLLSRTFSPRILACGIGVIHGVAGPGGVLGVVPAVHLRDWKLAAMYLGTFCLTSIVVMGTFAALYGTVSERISRATHWEFRVEVFSASLSVLVGVTWLALLSAGKLHDVFP